MRWFVLMSAIVQAALSTNYAAKCERITVPACQGLGYNTTSMPNILGDRDQRDATLKLQQFDRLLLRHECSPFLRLFMCSVFVPLCSEYVPGPVPACRGLCEEVHKNCLPVFESIGLAWPIDCSKFPEPPDLCMQQPSDDDALEASAVDFLAKDRSHKSRTFPQFCPPDTVLVEDKCFKICNSTITDDLLLYKIWSIVWATLCFFFTSFALVTFMMDSKRFRWPARPILYLTASGFVHSNILLLRFFVGSFTCKGEISVQKPYDNFICVFVALLIIFLDFSYTMWWCAMSYVWFLSASKEWSTEAIEKISSRVHFAIWTTSLIPIVCALFSNKIKVNDFTGFCQFSSHALLLVEMLVIAFGLFLAVRTSIGLRGVRKALVCAGRSPYKLERLILRLCIISLGVCLPWIVSVLCEFFADNFSLDMLKVGAKFLSFIFASFWVLSPKTFKTWNKLLRLTTKDKTVVIPITKV